MGDENDKLLIDIKKRLECLILLECKRESTEKEKLKMVSQCIGVSETARMLNKDLSNFSKSINNKWIKKKNEKKEG